MKMIIEIEKCSGNTNHNYPPLKIKYKSCDSEGKYCYFNRGRVINQLLNFLFDNDLSTPFEIIAKASQYDKAERVERGIIRRPNIGDDFDE
jgi:hypothetical protein